MTQTLMIRLQSDFLMTLCFQINNTVNLLIEDVASCVMQGNFNLMSA